MNLEDHDEFLCRIAKTLYYGNTTSFDSVSLPLTELAAELYNEVKKDSGLDRLQVQDIAEFNQNACVSTCSLVLAILYIEKMKSTNPEYIEKVTPSELFFVSLLIASKFLNDNVDEDFVLNSEWAVCAGLSLKEVNNIEKRFLEAIKWELYVADKQFWKRLLEMERYLANQEGKRRGWYSYTELAILITDRNFSFLKELLKFSVLCLMSYVSSVLIMIGIGVVMLQTKQYLFSGITNDLIPCTTVSTTTSCTELTADNNETSKINVATNSELIDVEISVDQPNFNISQYNEKFSAVENITDYLRIDCCPNLIFNLFLHKNNLPFKHISRIIQHTKKQEVFKKDLMIFSKYS